MRTYVQRLLSLATPLLMLSGSIAAQSAQSEGGAGFGSSIRSAESSQEGNGAISMKVMPERVTIVPELPERVEVLSLNNSLINFQRQDTIWNNIAAKMGKDAEWTLHTILGQPLSFHWMETDEAGCNSEGQPSAKSMIKLKPWTHIILQEQTDRPRVEYEDFRESVGKWVDFIRNNCPNPHAVIILPVNWVLTSCLDTYSETVNLVIDNYRKVAQEFGVVLAPVSSAYRMCYEREGVTALKKWYTDDRHPTIDAAYLAACIEYATIYGEDPTTISWAPRKISPQEALRIREYAKEALTDYTQTVDHHKGTVQLQARLYDATGRALPDDGMTEWGSNGATVNHEGLFTASNEMADYIVTATNGAIKSSATVTVAKAITRIEGLPVVELDGAEASYSQNFDTMGNSPTLPEGWRTDGQDGYARTLGYFVLANDETQFVQADDLVTLDANAACGTWNFGQRSDRAVGGITSGRSNEPRVINVYLHVRNTGTTPIVQPLLSYDIEKYRKGKNKAGFNVLLFTSRDGIDWTKAEGDVFKSHFEADEATEGYASVPGETRQVIGQLQTTIQPGDDLFLAWSIRVADGYSSGEAIALGIDNVCLNCPPASITTARGTQQHDTQPRYNLSGQRVNADYHGIVVSDGQKIVQ